MDIYWKPPNPDEGQVWKRLGRCPDPARLSFGLVRLRNVWEEMLCFLERCQLELLIFFHGPDRLWKMVDPLTS